jgi:hypothetical protein
MAKTNTTTISIGIQGDGFAGSTNGTYSNAQSNGAGLPPSSVVTSNGSTTVTIPGTALGYIIVPPPGSAVTKILKGVAGDTGVNLAPNLPTSVPLTAALQASFVLTCNGIETVTVFWQ